MSITLDIQNSCEDGGYESGINSLMGINKDFLENSGYLTNTNLSPSVDSLIPDQFFSDDNNKDGKIEAFNVYNKYVFFTNNINNTTTARTNTNHSKPLPIINNNSKPKYSVKNNNDSHNQNGKMNLVEPYKFSPGKSLNNSKSSIRKLKRIENRGINTKSSSQPSDSSRKQHHTLFFPHDNVLKPIISPMIKPGVYRKLCNESNDSSKVLKSQPNVCLSTSDRYGKIMTLDDFQKQYVDVSEIEKNVQSGIEHSFIEDVVSCSPSNSLISSPLDLEKVPPSAKLRKREGHPPSSDTSRTLTPEVLKLRGEEFIIINKSKNEIICKNPITRKRIRYRLVRPDNFDDLKDPNNQKHHESSANLPDIKDCLLPFYNADKPDKNNKRLRRGRPSKKSTNCKLAISTVPQQQKSQSVSQQQNTAPPKIIAKTRCGRISKLPSYIQEDFSISVNDTKDVSQSLQIRSTIEDKDFKCDKSISKQEKVPQNIDLKTTRKERTIPSRYQCEVCKKVFIGKRMQKHYEAYPDHNVNSQGNKQFTEISLYEFLVKKIKLLPDSEEYRTETFLNEISDLVGQLQSRSSRLVQNTSGMHFVNSRTSKVLGIPEGHYRIDVNAIDAPPDPIRIEENLRAFVPPPPRLDYNLSISLDDTIADAKLNMITSDDSLLRTVNDLMEHSIRNLDNNENAVHYDHVNDNAVEAVSIKETTQPPSALLDLSLDNLIQFQFNSD